MIWLLNWIKHESEFESKLRMYRGTSHYLLKIPCIHLNNAQKRPPPGTISAPFIMAVRGTVLNDFVCVSGANLNEDSFEILSKPLVSCLLNHWMTTNCLPSESCKNTMHFPKYMLLLVVPWMFSSSSHTLRQSCATIPWYRGMARKKQSVHHAYV